MMRRVMAVFCAVCTVCLCGCRSETTGGVFSFPLSAEPVCLDAQLATDDASLTVIEMLFEGLAARDGNGEVVPAAAEWTVSADGLTYVFTLRDACWSNNDPVTADDFLFAYERVQSLNTSAPSAVLLRGLAAVTAPDSKTLRVTLAAPDDGFLDALADVGWYPCPRAFFAECGGGWGMEPQTSLQNGPFVLSSWQHDQTLTLRKNKAYRAADEILPAVVRYTVGTTATEDFAAVEDGDLPTGTTVYELADTLQYLWFNTSAPPLTSAAVRRAFRDAVEWDRVSDLLGDEVTASYVSPLATVRGEDYCSSLTAHTAAPDRAAFAAAVAETGEAECPALTLLCEDTDEARVLAQYIVQSWQKHLSVYFRIEQVSAATLRARLVAGNYYLALAPATAAGDSPADALALFDGDASGGNWARYRDEEWSAALATAHTAADFQALESRLAEGCPAVPLSVVTRRYVQAKEISGVTLSPFTARVDFRRATRAD